VTTFLRSWAGYGAASTALTLLVVVLFPGISGAAGLSGVVSAAAVTALADALESALLSRAFGRDSDVFMRAWGAGLVVKTSLLGGAALFVVATRIVEPTGFVQTLIAAFLVFTHVGIVRLARASNATPRRAPSAPLAG
jgi:hypothetical protein